MNIARYKFFIPYLLAVAGVAVLTAGMFAFGRNINQITVALILLLFVLFIATLFGSKPAMLTSVLAMLCFNYFFLPPIGTLTIYDTKNWVALFAFLIVAITAGQLSAKAKRRAEEAERLYRELQTAFEKASEAEALRRSENLKSALLDAVTHDLRTPLTSIKAAVTTLLDNEGGNRTLELDAESRAEFLEIINEETDRLNNFIEDLIELARFEAGAINLRQTFSSVEEIISIAIRRAETFLKNHQIHIKIERDLPLVRVDPKALAEVIYTLLDNAAKYSPERSRITVRAVSFDSGVKISVTDEGMGIPAEMREKVFEKFVRGEKNPVVGLGLGLAIARAIVESHNGKIRIEESDTGRGTKVVFTIPLDDEK